MVDIVTRSFLGQWGQALLDVYLNYSLWINLFILLYFLVLLISQRNYRWTLAGLIEEIEKSLPQSLNKKSIQQVSRLLSKQEIPWEAALQVSRWPLIASPRQLIPRIRSTQTLIKLYPIDTLATFLVHRADSNTNLNIK
jgi:hypothetical protein